MFDIFEDMERAFKKFCDDSDEFIEKMKAHEEELKKIRKEAEKGGHNNEV